MSKDLNTLCIEYQTKDRKHRPNYGNPDGFEPCPFCGACPHIRVEDDEGNCHDYDPDYEKNPWSGLWYVIEHTRDYGRKGALKNTGDIPHSKSCLLATEGFQWHGAGDGYTDWFEYKHTNCFWKKMKAFFDAVHKTDEDRFYSTEYTSLRKHEREKVKKLELLKHLSSYIHGFGSFSELTWRELNSQGHYFMHKYCNGSCSLPVFIENNPYNEFRMRYKTADEKRIELESQIAGVKSELTTLEDELRRLK